MSFLEIRPIVKVHLCNVILPICKPLADVTELSPSPFSPVVDQCLPHSALTMPDQTIYMK